MPAKTKLLKVTVEIFYRVDESLEGVDLDHVHTNMEKATVTRPGEINPINSRPIRGQIYDWHTVKTEDISDERSR